MYTLVYFLKNSMNMVLCVHQQISNHICIEVVCGRGRPIDSYKTIMSTDDDDGQ